MSELEWKLAYPLENNTAIKKMVKIFGKEFPAEFSKVIIEFNEASPSKRNFQTIIGAEHEFCNLLSFNEEEDTNVFNTLEILRGNGLEEELLPFGEDPFGNYLCLCYDEKDIAVVFWNHETNKIERVSNSFSEFLEKLY